MATTRQVDDLLQVHEEEAAYFVTLERDPEDWLVRFEKAPDFAARDWAENMVETYNERYLHPDNDVQRWTARPPEIDLYKAE